MKPTVLISGLVLGVAGAASLALSDEHKGQSQANTSLQLQSASFQSHPQTGSDLPVIVHIEKRDRVITIKSSPKGTVYTVKSKDGKALFEDLSAEQLRAQAPELGEFLKTAVAGRSDAKLRMKADARSAIR